METNASAMDWSKVSEVELIYKSKVKAADRPLIKKSHDIYELLKTTWNEGTIDLQEEFKVLLLNRANRVLGIYHASKGGLVSTVVDIRLLFAAALKAGSTCIVLTHNHPSGNFSPSVCDQELTRKVFEAGKLLDIKLLDHIIISTSGYYSFADEGLL